MSDDETHPHRDNGLTLLSTQGSRALARVLISGYVDAYALLTFGVFASFMTGNTTSGGVHAGKGNLAAAGHSLLPIPFFVAGILAGTLLVHTDRQRALRRISVFVAVMLALGVAGTYFAWPGWLGIMLLSSAMGLLNTSVTQVGGQPISLGFMTGDLNNLAQHISQAILRAPVSRAQGPSDTHWRRAALLASLWVFFLARSDSWRRFVFPPCPSGPCSCLPALLVLLAVIEPAAVNP